MDPQKARVKAKYLHQQRENQRIRRGGRILGLTLGLTAVTIYFYSMYTVKQETIVREIEEEINNA